MRYYLYQIRNKFNGKYYIGVTTRPEKRFKEHLCGYGSLLIKRALLKYGPNAFEFKILVIGDKEYIYDLEIKTIAKFQTQVPLGYNLSEGGECPPIGNRAGRKHSEISKKKNSDAHRGKKHSKETKKKMSIAGKGKHSKKVMVMGTVYNSIQEAAEDIGIRSSAIRSCFQRYRKANKFPFDWKYL